MEFRPMPTSAEIIGQCHPSSRLRRALRAGRVGPGKARSLVGNRRRRSFWSSEERWRRVPKGWRRRRWQQPP
eukprot:11183882-Lingulodinium_polyedra.AAC.1